MTKLQEWVGEIKKSGGEAILTTADVSKHLVVDRIVKTTVNTFREA